MPLPGTLDVAAAAAGAPVIPTFDVDPLTLRGAHVLQAFCEMSHPGRITELLPPATRGSVPALASVLVLRCDETDVGPITMAQVRVCCRTAMQSANYLISAVVSEPTAAGALAARWGFRCRVGEVSLQTHYDRVDASVALDGRTILELSLIDPHPIAATDLVYGPTLSLAETPRGLRLVHFEPEITVHKADRGVLQIPVLDGAAWGDDRVDAVYPISASAVVADLVFPTVTRLSLPDTPPPQGLEILE